VEKEHGRFEKRRYWITGKLDDIKERDKWPTLTSVGMVESQRTVDGINSTEVRYFISSLLGDDAEKFANAARGHWSVENNLHWVLDVAFDEDQSRVRKDNAPENMAMLRHVALNLIKADKLVKRGVQTRRKACRLGPQLPRPPARREGRLHPEATGRQALGHPRVGWCVSRAPTRGTCRAMSA
jgi:predicted transposase YbfD/YdcC